MWTISNNSFYQAGIRTYTTASIHTAINAITGNGHTITGNFIGGSASNASGTTYSMVGAVASRFIGINVSSSVGATTSLQNNTISNFFLSTTSSAGPGTGIFCGISAGGAGTFNIGTTTGNIIGANSGTASISTVSTSATGTTIGINASATGNANIQNNGIGALQATSPTATIACAVIGVYVGAVSTSLNISNNTIGNATANNMQAGNAATTTASSTATGVNLAFTPTSLTFNNNTIQNFISYGNGTAGFARGFFTSTTATAGTTFTITNNTIRNLTTNTAFAGLASGLSSVVGLHMLSAANATISGNTINNLSNTNTTATTNVLVSGINLASATLSGVIGTSCFNNRIYDLRNSTVGVTATAPSIVAGIAIRSGNANTNVYNNMISIGNAQTTNTAFVGIWGNHGSTPNPVTNIYYNSVNIEGTASAGALSSFGYLRGDFTATARTPIVDIRNNIFTNSRTGGTGSHYAISNNFGATVSTIGWGAGASNYNVLNSSSASTVGFWTSAQTIAGWRTASSGDANAISGIAVNFSNTVTGDLHLNFGLTPTLVESGGQIIAGYTTDYDAEVRPGPAGSVNGGGALTDIGADEADAVPLDIAPPVIIYTALTSTCLTTNRTFTSTITDISGVPTSGALQPRVYYRKNAGVWISSQGTLSSGTGKNGVWSFTIIAADMGGLVASDIVEYYVIAQDITTPTAFITSNPAAGLVATDVNTVTTAPTTPNTYTIPSTLSGTYTVGVAGTYPTLTAAINAYNTNCLGGAIVFELLDATYTAPAETFPIQINANANASAINTLTIRLATGVTSSITGSATGALIRLNGANYVTIDGSNSGGTDRSLTIENTSITTPNVVVIGSLGTTTVTNNTLRNCVIRNGVTTSSAVVISDATTIGTTGYFNNITIHNNDIQKAFIGVFATGGTTPQNGTNLTYTANTLNTIGANAIRLAGLYMQGVNGATVSNNTVGNFSNTDGENDVAIWLATGTSNATVSNNTISNLGMTLTTAFAPYGIRESSGLATSGSIIRDNSVSNISTTGTTQVYGIDNGSGGTIIERNNVQGIINNSTATYGSYGINTTAGNNVVIRNNFISNISQDMTGGGAFSTTFGVFGIRLAAGTGHQVYHNSVNLYGPLTGTANTSLLSAAFAIVGTTSTGCDVRNNIFANNITGGTTSIAQVAVYLPSGGTSAMNLTLNNNSYFYGTDAARQGSGQAGTTAGTNFYTTLAAQAAYTTTLAPAGTNDNVSFESIGAVPYLTATDLHLAPSASCATTGKGANITSVTDDIDRNSRNALPFIGAHEAYEPSTASTLLFNTTPGTTNRTYVVNGATDYLKDCELITTLTPSGASPLAGPVNAKVTIDATVQTFGLEAYVQRHYDIEPVNNAATATALVKFYFTDAEFINFNSNNGAGLDLPTVAGGGNADPNLANVRVTQFHGTGTAPGNYTGSAEYLIPSSVIYNATSSRWEVTINVAGFSGFYIHTGPGVLPLKLIYFTGEKQADGNRLDWKVTCIGSPSVVLTAERSADGRTFSPIYNISASSVRCETHFNTNDLAPVAGENYYRLKMVDIYGNFY